MVRKNSLLLQGYPCFHHVFLGIRHVRMIRGLRYRTFGLTYLQTHVSPTLTQSRKAPEKFEKTFQRIKPTKSSRNCWRLQHCCTENTYNNCVGLYDGIWSELKGLYPCISQLVGVNFTMVIPVIPIKIVPWIPRFDPPLATGSFRDGGARWDSGGWCWSLDE